MPLKNSNPRMMVRVKNLIQNNQTMTLATACDNRAWAAPVFYVSTGSGFYFFSNPDARHIEEALASGQAACTIHEEDASWQNLAGLQMSGKVMPISVGVEASKVILAYVKKFPLVKPFFSGIPKISLNDFICKFHANLYCFIPERIFLMDNSVEFGFRTEIETEIIKEALLK